MKNTLLFLLSLQLLFGSCKTDQSTDNATVDKNRNSETITIAESYGCEAPGQACVDIKINYPALKNYAERDKEPIHYYIRGYVADFLVTDKPIDTKDLKAFLQQSSRAIINASKQSSYASDYLFHSHFDLLFETPELVCLKNSYHLNDSEEDVRSVGYAIFDLTQQDILSVDQIVKDETLLAAELLKEVKHQANISEQQDISSHGYYVSDRDFAVTNNIGITKDSIIFSYSPMEILPADEGVVRIKKHKKDIIPFLHHSFVSKWDKTQ